MPVHTAGLYSPVLKQLLIWNLPNRTDMLRTIRHEGFHQYLDTLAKDVPPWLNEGMAEYYQGSRSALGRPSPGRLQPRHLRSLALMRGKGRVPVEELTRMPYPKFYANPINNYAQGWALVHFLRRSTRRNRAIMDRLLQGLKAGKPYDAVRKEAFAGVDMKHLDAKFWEYVRALREKKN